MMAMAVVTAVMMQVMVPPPWGAGVGRDGTVEGVAVGNHSEWMQRYVGEGNLRGPRVKASLTGTVRMEWLMVGMSRGPQFHVMKASMLS